jgi:hypothetical protein
MSLVLGCFFVIGSSKGGDSLVSSLGRRGGVASSEVGKDLMRRASVVWHWFVLCY